MGRRDADQHPDHDARGDRASDPRLQPRPAGVGARGHRHPRHARHRARRGAARIPDDDHPLQGGAAGDRLPRDGEQPLFRRHGGDLRHADGRRARHRARRADRRDHPRGVLLPDPRAVRLARYPPSREAEGRMSWEIVAVLGLPLVGGGVMALAGHTRLAEDHGRINPARLRLFHSMYQLFVFTMLLVLTTNNMGLMWVATEAATLTTVLLVSLYRTPASLEAAWKYFILCGVGIAQALFGTILLYMAAEKLLGAEGGALLWTALNSVKGQLEPTVLSIAFVFLLVGYGTKVGLAPLHNWLPDAHAEGPTPVSAVLSGLLLNVALYAVIRCKALVEGSVGPLIPGRMLMAFGLLSVVVAAFLLSRQKDVKRLFAYSSVEHMGLMTFAFGMGGALATFAGLLHMTVHSLTKSAIFFAVGHAAQKSGTQDMASIRGLVQTSPAIGWGLALGTLAILGMPPFGVFTSEFMVLTTAMHEHSWATPLLLVALGVAFASIFGKVQPMVFGKASVPPLQR